MPIHPEILLSAEPIKVKSPAEAQMDRFKLKQAQQQTVLNDQEIAKGGAPVTDDALLQQMMQETGGDLAKMPGWLAQHGRFREAMEVLKGWDEHVKATATPPENASAFTLSPGQARYGSDGKLIASGPDAAPTAAAGFTLAPGQARYGADGKLLAEGPAAPAGTGPGSFTLSPGQQRFGADGAPLASVPAPKGGGAREPLIAVTGPDGKPVLIRQSQAEGMAPASNRDQGVRPSIGAEKTTLNFFNRAKQADEELAAVEAEVTKMKLGAQAWMSTMPNWAQSQTAQRYQQAQRAFTEARLRKDSGAAIPETEFTNDRKTYFAQPGDGPVVAAQKARSRAAVLASLAFGAGRALEEFYGDEASGMVEGFKSRSSTGGAAPATGQTVKAGQPKMGEQRMINGRRAMWDGKGWMPTEK